MHFGPGPNYRQPNSQTLTPPLSLSVLSVYCLSPKSQQPSHLSHSSLSLSLRVARQLSPLTPIIYSTVTTSYAGSVVSQINFQLRVEIVQNRK
ncbi:hypothetical protein F8388_010439 [Cannabis sativa]|uniref:Uncharacterized protein n=1 Tax=Cannabis sativa TaxID=3483 RepID=A0A7J6GSG6_CANSA|nr:hypothetical protein F8388_010439 [Cannabis sativa]KAF4397362.1 hypothetical protein G4B88_027102 [Cannabis sativa]